MATNTTTRNGQTPVTTGKTKKAARSTPAAPKKTVTRKRSTPANTSTPTYPEKIYDVQPNPYHQPVPPYVWIDHPQQNETLHAPEYVVRLGVGGEEWVELSINDSEWQPCRFTSGYWWYDWSNIQPGRHKLVARMKTANGEWFRTPDRFCTY